MEWFERHKKMGSFGTDYTYEEVEDVEPIDPRKEIKARLKNFDSSNIRNLEDALVVIEDIVKLLKD